MKREDRMALRGAASVLATFLVLTIGYGIGTGNFLPAAGVLLTIATAAILAGFWKLFGKIWP